MPTPENLPAGFERLPSGSLRVRIRLTGHNPVQKTFPLRGEGPAHRKRQLDEARTWDATTRQNLDQGTHIDISQIKDLTVGDVLRAFRDKGLAGSKEKNARKDLNRIKQVLLDDISSVRVLQLQTSRLAAYRDELIEQYRAKLRTRAEQKQSNLPSDLDGSTPESRPVETEKTPARSTLVNKIGVISRAMNYARENIHSAIPRVALPRMPRATPGRDRRVSEDELEAILRIGDTIDPVIPHIVKFAIATALRKEKILEFHERLVTEIGSGYQVIKYPRGEKPEKGVGFIPVTSDLRSLINEAKSALKVADPSARLFDIGEARFDNTWQETLAQAGIKDLHFHDLRHEATSKFFENGLGMIEVMSITGHSTTEMVKRYSHYSAIKIIKKLDRGNDLVALMEELSHLINVFLRSGGERTALDKLVATTANAMGQAA